MSLSEPRLDFLINFLARFLLWPIISVIKSVKIALYRDDFIEGFPFENLIIYYEIYFFYTRYDNL